MDKDCTTCKDQRGNDNCIPCLDTKDFINWTDKRTYYDGLKAGIRGLKHDKEGELFFEIEGIRSYNIARVFKHIDKLEATDKLVTQRNIN